MSHDALEHWWQQFKKDQRSAPISPEHTVIRYYRHNENINVTARQLDDHFRRIQKLRSALSCCLGVVAAHGDSDLFGKAFDEIDGDVLDVLGIPRIQEQKTVKRKKHS